MDLPHPHTFFISSTPLKKVCNITMGLSYNYDTKFCSSYNITMAMLKFPVLCYLLSLNNDNNNNNNKLIIIIIMLIRPKYRTDISHRETIL